MVGTTISHYRITEKLGEGGMGVVYKAEDTRLERTVALKFLGAAALGDEEARARFVREARAAAALNHPNICTIYEIGEAEGRTFISMAYLEGRELAEEIADGPMEVERVLALAPQFADGLAEAHAKGIVHRDIKPANLFVTSNGRGVILDFGLAQLASAQSKLTREGTTLGTCAYMSPEQAMGEDVEAPTDVWALGCVLYEMLAGQAPFRGHYEQAIVYSILNEDPEPLEAGPEVEAVIRRCLAKDPGERYQDGEALHRALRELQPSPRPSTAEAPAASSDVPRVAVLPLKTRAGDAELEPFGEGLTEEITSALSQFRHLIVVSASAAARCKGPVDLAEVGRQLDARFLLEGSAR
jgi:serine/threonine protein kinase